MTGGACLEIDRKSSIPGCHLTLVKLCFRIYSLCFIPPIYTMDPGSKLSLLFLSQSTVPPKNKMELSCCFCYVIWEQACFPLILQWRNRRGFGLLTSLRLEPPFSPRSLVLRVPAPSAHPEVLLPVTCLISEHPNSSLFVFAAQLTF